MNKMVPKSPLLILFVASLVLASDRQAKGQEEDDLKEDDQTYIPMYRPYNPNTETYSQYLSRQRAMFQQNYPSRWQTYYGRLRNRYDSRYWDSSRAIAPVRSQDLSKSPVTPRPIYRPGWPAYRSWTSSYTYPYRYQRYNQFSRQTTPQDMETPETPAPTRSPIWWPRYRSYYRDPYRFQRLQQMYRQTAPKVTDDANVLETPKPTYSPSWWPRYRWYNRPYVPRTYSSASLAQQRDRFYREFYSRAPGGSLAYSRITRNMPSYPYYGTYYGFKDIGSNYANFV